MKGSEVGGGRGGAPTLLGVCSRLGMGERNSEGERGEGGRGEGREWGRGWVPGIWSPSILKIKYWKLHEFQKKSDKNYAHRTSKFFEKLKINHHQV